MTNRVGKLFSCFAPCASANPDDSPPPSDSGSPSSRPHSSPTHSPDLIPRPSPRLRLGRERTTPDNRPGSPASKLIRAAMERPGEKLAVRARESSRRDAQVLVRYSPPRAMTVESSLIERPASSRIDGTEQDFRAAIGKEFLDDEPQQKPELMTSKPYRLGDNAFESVHPPRLLPLEQRELVGLARWPDAAFNQEDKPAQKQYARYFHALVQEAGERLRNGQIAEFDQLWIYARHARAFLEDAITRPAQDLTPTNIRVGIHNAILAGAGALLHQRIPLQVSSSTQASQPYGYILGRLDGMPRTTNADRTRERYFWTEEVDGRPEALTTIECPIDRRGNRRKKAPADILHIAPCTEIMDMLRQQHFERLMARPLPIEQLLPGLAELHFWLAHAMPDARGSAAKSEIAVRAIACAHGFDLPPFKRGFVPDMEAFVTPLRDYVRQYALHLEDSDVLPRSRSASPGHGDEAGPSHWRAG